MIVYNTTMGFIYKVYKLGDPTQFYVGSTSQRLSIRLSLHRAFARKGSADLFHSAMRAAGEDMWDIESVEEVDEGDDIREREQYYIETLKPPLNSNRAILTPEQRQKSIIEKNLRWRAANKYRYRCKCGFHTDNKYDFARHLSRKFGVHNDISNQ
jgi:hypothetical protein